MLTCFQSMNCIYMQMKWLYNSARIKEDQIRVEFDKEKIKWVK